MISFQFYISPTDAEGEPKTDATIAGEVRAMLKYRALLMAGGVPESNVARTGNPAMPASGSQTPLVARIASPVIKTANLATLERQWGELTGTGFRCTPQMRETFGLAETRELQIARMIELATSGAIAKTVSGWKWTGASETSESPREEAPEVDPTCGV